MNSYLDKLPENCLLCNNEDCEHQYIECCYAARHPDCPLNTKLCKEFYNRINYLETELKTKNEIIQLLRRHNVRLKIIYNSLYGIPNKNPKLNFLNQLIRSTYNMNSEELKVYLDLVDDGLITTETPKEEVDQMIEAKLSGDNNE